MKVLIITRHYLDENNGGANGSKAYITALSNIYNGCDLIYPEREFSNSTPYISDKIKKLPCFDKRTKIKKGIDIYRGKLHRFYSFTKEQLKNKEYDIIFIDHSLTASRLIHLIRKTNSKIVTIHHNVEAEYIKDNKPSILYRYPYSYYIKKAEIEALTYSDLNLTVTQNDANLFKTMCKKNKDSIKVMGTFEYRDITYHEKAPSQENYTFVISGSLNFPQTELGILEFLKVYYPILNEQIPTNKLIITGRNPSKKIVSECSKFTNIQLIINPENITEIIEKGSIYICPLNTGSGVKLRIMDGLKLGLPILTHKISANGYEAIRKANYLFEYDSVDSFKQSLIKCMNTTIDKVDVFNTYQSYFSFEAGQNRLQNILNESNLI